MIVGDLVKYVPKNGSTMVYEVKSVLEGTESIPGIYELADLCRDGIQGMVIPRTLMHAMVEARLVELYHSSRRPVPPSGDTPTGLAPEPSSTTFPRELARMRGYPPKQKGSE